jgi:tRNA dimethylallyltransferase
MKPIIVIISGPTATGKTNLSLTVAKKYNAEIINFDSLLFYKELNIGTAKPNKNELNQVKHHLISNTTLDNPLDANGYIIKAQPLIKHLIQENKNIILVGGSGFYLRALMNGMYESITPTPEIVSKVNSLYVNKDIKPLRKILLEIDKDSYEKLHENDHYRIIRAVEHFWMTGKKISEQKAKQNSYQSASFKFVPTVKCVHFYLDIPKEKHWEIICKRTNEMIDKGLIEEVKVLLRKHSGKERPLQSIGYKETIDYINNKYESKEQYIERINISTRQLAKSQRTWFNKVSPKINVNPFEQIDYVYKEIDKTLFIQ